MKLIELSLKNSMLLNLLTTVMLIAGIVTAITMNREAFPAIDFDTVTINTVYPGASPKEVEQDVTNLIEEELKSVDGIEEMVSSSIENNSLIVIKLNPDLSESLKSAAKNDVQRAVDRVRNLPKGVLDAPLVKELSSGDMPVMELAISGDLPYSELHRMADELIERIEALPDAKDTLKYGFYDKEFWVEVDPNKLRKQHIGLVSVVSTLASRNLNLPGGILKSDRGEFLVRTIGEVETTAEVDNILLRTNSANIAIRVKDIGKTASTFEESQTSYRTNTLPSINLIIRKKATGDIITLVEKVKEVVGEYQKIPGNAQLKASYVNDMSIFVQNRLGVLLSNGYMGVVLVLLGLLLFLSKGIAIVAALGMPVAFIGAILVMNWLGMTINLISLFALVIVLGMLVDDAIIVAENIFQHYERGENPWKATINGTKEVFWPVTATILTTIAAFSPLLMVSGIFGKFISALPKVVIISLVISLIEAMFILPSHAYEMLRLTHWRNKNKPGAHQRTEKKGPMHKAIEFYGRLLHSTLRLRYLFAIAITAALGGTIYYVTYHMKTVLFPSDGVEAFFVRTNLPSGTPLAKTSEAFKSLENSLKEIIPQDELRDIVTYIGLQQNDSLDPFRISASHLGQVGVYLTPEIERVRTADEIIESIRPILDQVVKEQNLAPIIFERLKIGPPVGQPVAIRIKGDSLEDMQATSASIMTALREEQGVMDISMDFKAGKKELQIYIDEKKASQSLLTAEDIALHVRASIEGQVATYIHEDGERVPLRVRYGEKYRNNTEDLNKLMITNRRGLMIPLHKVATLKEAEGINNIKHRDGQRVITITAAIDESTTTSTAVNLAIAEKLGKIKADQPKLIIETGGEYEDTNKSMESLKQAFFFAIMMIFIILATQFKSLTQPFVVMSAIPFGIIGVVVAFSAHGLPLSFLGMIGMIGLTGVVVNDSIVLVDFINKNRQRGMNSFEAAIHAGKRRFRAVWLTSITTILGLMPLVYGIGGDDRFLRPAAMALGYGLTFGTVLILLFIPVLYLIRIDLINFFYYFLRPVARWFGADLEKVV